MISTLQQARIKYQPKLPQIFTNHGARALSEEKSCQPMDEADGQIKNLFTNLFGTPMIRFENAVGKLPQEKINVGVIFSGGQAPGGHNVIAGLQAGLSSLNKDNVLYGFHGGPNGLVTSEFTELSSDFIKPYQNTGGFNMIGSGRTKLETVEQFETVCSNCKKLDIKALVIIGGDDSNTNACLLAEYCVSNNSGIQVIGCPKTIDGDLKNEWIEVSFGFDTACKVYSDSIGNICRDALSAKKYWHFIKVMGRSASHIALECALQSHPNITIISEEVARKEMTLDHIIDEICDVIVKRANLGLDFGVVLIPEGLIEFISEMKILINELNNILASNPSSQNDLSTSKEVGHLTSCGLSEKSAKAYISLPSLIRSQLVMDRDPHGNVQVAKIETEKLVILKVEERLSKLAETGEYVGTFSPVSHYLGYEGRCALPTNFDSNYCYSLGYTAATLIGAGKTGYLAAIQNLYLPVSEWIPLGIPITAMMNMEQRHGKPKPVIRKALVDLEDKPFQILAKNREDWGIKNLYLSPGPIQFFGPEELVDSPTITLRLEHDI